MQLGTVSKREGMSSSPVLACLYRIDEPWLSRLRMLTAKPLLVDETASHGDTMVEYRRWEMMARQERRAASSHW